MLKFRDLPVKQKLTAIIMFTCSLVLLLTCAVSITDEMISFRKGMIQNISTLAEVIGINSTAALAFQDPETAEEILTALSAEPNILTACVYRNNGDVFAVYNKNKSINYASPDGNTDPSKFQDETLDFSEFTEKHYRFSGKCLDLVKPIILGGKEIGKVHIQSDLKHLYYRLKWFVGIQACVMLALFFLAYLVSSKLQRIISEPISRLAETMKSVSTLKDYSVKAKKDSNDEMGALIEGFNEMLEQIRVRDGKLEKAVVEAKKAEKSAELANRSKSDFLANMSHELRTPLNHIIGFTELILDKHFGVLNDIQEEYLNDVLKSSNHLLSLINDILDLSKVEAGKLELENSDVIIDSLLKDSLTMIQEKAMKHGIELQADIEKIPYTITSDERKLKQILYNLLSNAIKFTPDGGKIRLSADLVDGPSNANPYAKRDLSQQQDTGMRPAPNKIIQISVEDTGVGLNNEEIERIFQPFQQGDDSINRKHEGTGLGLSLTKKLVELHGGNIWVESKGQKRGSAFRFTIPG